MEQLPNTKEQDRKNLEALNRAYLHFAKGEYEEQSEYMFLIEQEKEYQSKDPYDSIGFRTLGLKTAFIQLGEKPKARIKESFQGKIAAYFGYIERKKDLPDSAKASRTNFAKALRQIFLSRHGKHKIKGDLRKQILAMQPITELPWLLSQLK